MAVTGVNSLSGSAGLDSGWASTTRLSTQELLSDSDEQLRVLAARGNTQAILELEKRDAARKVRVPASPDQNQPAAAASPDAPTVFALEKRDATPAADLPASTALAVTPDTPAILGLEQPGATQAAKLPASADQAVAAAAEESGVGAG